MQNRVLVVPTANQSKQAAYTTTAMTARRVSTAVSVTCWWTPSDWCSLCWSPRQIFQNVKVYPYFSSIIDTCCRDCITCSSTGATKGLLSSTASFYALASCSRSSPVVLKKASVYRLDAGS